MLKTLKKFLFHFHLSNLQYHFRVLQFIYLLNFFSYILLATTKPFQPDVASILNLCFYKNPLNHLNIKVWESFLVKLKLLLTVEYIKGSKPFFEQFLLLN